MDDYEEEPMEMMEEPALAEESGPDTDTSDLESEEDMELDAALNTALPLAERRTALKNAIQICVQREMGGEYGSEKETAGEGDMFASLLGEG